METLDPRLKVAADMVRIGSKTADIGCDHAYLSIYLVNNNISPSVLACDLRKGPLENAKNNIILAGLVNRIETRLTSGLVGITGSEVDDVVICGMGGITITEIIEEASWLKDKSKNLVLQPMTHASFLRKYLFDNGFEIVEEKTVISTGKVYSCMRAQYFGEKIEYSNIDCIIGKISGASDTDKTYIEKEIAKLEKKNAGLNSSKTGHEEEISYNNDCLLKLRNMLS